MNKTITDAELGQLVREYFTAGKRVKELDAKLKTMIGELGKLIKLFTEHEDVHAATVHGGHSFRGYTFGREHELDYISVKDVDVNAIYDIVKERDELIKKMMDIHDHCAEAGLSLRDGL